MRILLTLIVSLLSVGLSFPVNTDVQTTPGAMIHAQIRHTLDVAPSTTGLPESHSGSHPVAAAALFTVNLYWMAVLFSQKWRDMPRQRLWFGAIMATAVGATIGVALQWLLS